MYINATTNKLYTSESDIFIEYPNVSFPIGRLQESFADLDIYYVYVDPEPSVDFFHKAVQHSPVYDLETNCWKATWSIEEQVRTPEEIHSEQTRILTQLTEAIQEFLDTKVRERNYDGILSLCTYAASTIEKFRLEGQAGVNWRDSCWATAYHIMDEVLTGQRPIPTVEELLSELPKLVWPDEVVNG